jgi:hypothetical protein
MPEESNRHQEGYETKDLNTGAIAGFAAILFILATGALIVTTLLIRGFENKSAERGAGEPAAALSVPEGAGPGLEQNPKTSRQELMKPAFDRLDAFGVASEPPLRLHVPVETAIELIASGQAPYKQRPAPAFPAQPETGAADPGEPVVE